MNRFLSLALLLVIVLGTIRGGATTISKYISINDIPPIGYALWQSTIAATLLILLAFSADKTLPSIRNRPGYFLFCGIIGTAVPNTIFFISVRDVPAGTMAVLLTLVPILVYFFVLIMRLEKMDVIRMIGIALGFAGAFVIASNKLVGGFGVDNNILFAMLCPLGYALLGVFVAKQNITNIHPFQLAAGTHIVAVVFLLPSAFLTGQFHPIWDRPGLADGLILTHGIMSAISYVLFFVIVKLAGAVFYSLSHYVIAATGLLWGWILFNETHGPTFWFAVFLILGGLTLVNVRQPTRKGK